jgi:hypothetical protein
MIDIMIYQLFTRSINFLIIRIKLDLVFLYIVLSIFNIKPIIHYLNIIKKIFRYI